MPTDRSHIQENDAQRERLRALVTGASDADLKRPLEAGCDCPACGPGLSRAWLRHLFLAGEMLGPILVSLHNLRHFQRLLLDIRAAIREDSWFCLARDWPVLAETT